MSRRKARALAMQAVYQWQLNDDILENVIQQFVESNDMSKIDFEHFKKIVTAAVNHTPELDAIIKPHLDRDIKELNPVELAVLRLSVYEMKHCLDIPYRVVINEGIELTKKYGATDSYKYVNGVLDKLAPVLRRSEFN